VKKPLRLTLRKDEELLEIAEIILNKAKIELLNPPVIVNIKLSKGDILGYKFNRKSGGITVNIPRELLLNDVGKEIVLWFFRHILSHVHYCPYDMKTAFNLQKLAYKITRNWWLAYIALYFFTEMQVDLVYLPSIFYEKPTYLMYRYRYEPIGPLQLLYAAYRIVYPDLVRYYNIDPLIEDGGRQLTNIILKPKPWSSKIKLVASIVSRIRELKPRLFRPRKMKEIIRERPILVREDLTTSGLRDILEVYGGVKDEETAKKFFEQWIEPRVEESKAIKKKMEEVLKKIKSEYKQIAKSKKSLEKRGEKSYEKVPADLKAYHEPYFTTKDSKLISKIHDKRLLDAWWRKYWYKARAERILMSFIRLGRKVRPTWSILAYPDQWLVEDEIEDLDIEASIDEGPLIPEVTTVKWITKPSELGQYVSSEYIPSAIIALDSSQSMSNTRNNAAIAAFIAYLSAKRAGGKTAIINFSTNYISAPWDSDDEVKELTLSISQGAYTILPVHEIERLVAKVSDKTYIFIISDCGWQNIDEALKRLSKIGEKGHEIIVFHLYGFKYRERLKMVSRNPHITVIHIDDPERDLEGLMVEEATKIYGRYFTLGV